MFKKASSRRRKFGIGVISILTLVVGALIAIPAFGGHGDGTPEVTPTAVAGNPDCASRGLGNEFRIDPTRDGTFSTTIAGIGTVSITLDVNEGEKKVAFDISDNAVALVVINKGGSGGANVYDYRPGGINHDDGLITPGNSGLSHMSFCLAAAPAELDIQKTPDGGSVNVGSAASFTLTVRNTSTTVTAQNVVIDDTLPNTRFTWSENPNTAECTVTSGHVLHCDVGNLAPNGTFSVTVRTATDRNDCGPVNNPDARTDADNADPDTDSGSLTVRCGAVKITKTAKDKSGQNRGRDAQFTIDDAGTLAPIVVNTGSDGEVCVDGLRLGSATITETVPAGYAANPASRTVTVTAGSCGAATAVPATFENIPLTDVDITVDSQVDGATETTIVCRDAAGNIVDQTTVSDGSLSLDDQQPRTLDCQIVIDP
jgi:uncharacterized repeat protein (TIGR01451 family)